MSRLLSMIGLVVLALLVVASSAEAGPTTRTAAPRTAPVAKDACCPPGGCGPCGCGEGAYPWYRCRPKSAVKPCAPTRWRARYYRPSCYDAGWYGARCRRFQANGWRRGTGPVRR